MTELCKCGGELSASRTSVPGRVIVTCSICDHYHLELRAIPAMSGDLDGLPFIETEVFTLQPPLKEPKPKTKLTDDNDKQNQTKLFPGSHSCLPGQADLFGDDA